MGRPKTTKNMPEILDPGRLAQPIAVAKPVAAPEKGEGARGDRPVPPDDFTRSEFQPRSVTTQQGIFVTNWAMAVTKTKAELLVVAQMAYWLGVARNGKVRARIRRGGYLWVAKTYRKFGNEMCLTKDTVRGAMRALKRRGILVEGAGTSPGDIPIYRLCPVVIGQILAETVSPTDETTEDEQDEI
jgi:hypothetical protein